MNEKLKKAIRNSEALYASVFKAHGVELKRTEELYYSTEKVPPLNSNICTKSPAWRPDRVFEKIAQKAQEDSWSTWSIKDSFACLPLETYGFEKLFDAQWLYLPTSEWTPYGPPLLSFRRVNTKEELAEWVRVWGEDETLYIDAMLEDPTLTFVIGEGGDGERHAALLNTSNDVIGISNFFLTEGRTQKWSDLIAFIQETWGAIDVVGYEREDVLVDVVQLGIERVGKLSIWITHT